ncbi:hypothetical protein CPC08DRAFT_710330 [Agrocybe pediades]|nr:hypothetical protein CPC08DRAFT_710330 [Agrocybe pediades]
MSRFSVSRYNNLPSIKEADEKFDRQLADAKISRHDFFSHLAKLFVEENRNANYSPCLLHKHHLLEEGEKMVTEGKSTKPSRDNRVVAERWYPDGEEMEYVLANQLTQHISFPPPPSSEFMDKFRASTQQYGVDVLGVCLKLPWEELPPNSLFLEMTGAKDREQVVEIVAIDSVVEENAYETSWNITTQGPEVRIFCNRICLRSICTKEH